jgi:protein-S-isoprenylcysteine O-methyltransferase Ste14
VSDPRSRIFPPLIPALAIAIGWGIGRLAPLVLPLGGPVARWTGIAVIVAAVALAMAANLHFRRSQTPANPTQTVTAFVTSGPFRLTRNPMYLGLTLLQTGAGVWLRNAWILLLLPATFFVLDRVVIPGEERLLTQLFGADYAAYTGRVRRWL